MQPQGLAALMPQGQPAPQMNNPRLAAAMDVVTSDAEENILDPRTLAMLKYKDAVQAMQAADQMMAAAQPQPMPPTVAERTRLAAEQGIAGLAARLSPGVQQRGAQIAAQQGAGGLPQLAAPNMARMAGGGIVAFAPGGEVEAAQPKATSLRREKELVDAGVPPEEARRIARSEFYQGMGSLVLPTLKTLGDSPRRLFMEDLPKAYSAAERAFYENIEAPIRSAASSFFSGVGGNEAPLSAEEIAAQYQQQATPTLPRGLGVTSIMPGGVARSVETPQTAAAPTPSEIESVLTRMQAPEAQQVRRATTGEASGLEALLRKQLEAQLQPGFVDERGQAIEERAAAAYAVPKEMRDLIQARIAQMEKPEFTPEELRDRRIQAWLQGLASSPYIAESGVAAAQGREAVMERSRQDAKERADKQFELAYDLMGKDREASMNAFKDGLAASDRAMAQVTGAVQSAAGMISSELTREQAALIQESQNNMEALKAQAAAVEADLARGQKNTERLTAFYSSLVDESDNLARAIANISADTTLIASPEVQTLITELTAQKALVDEMKNAARLQSGDVVGVDVLSPEGRAALARYGRQQ